ncbi:hypothetical protein [Streptosporangium sp. NPDC000396]|uniref:hypothetical protein n=1 Tax=Streptosporangium sp. NPDC000396 TaxID=3366185 RepID=UPI00368DB8B5
MPAPGLHTRGRPAVYAQRETVQDAHPADVPRPVVGARTARPPGADDRARMALLPALP